jgi:hypothetical protein
MTTNRLTSIAKEVRASDYPALSEDLVLEVLDIQFRLQDDPSEARKRTRSAIHRHVHESLATDEGPEASR